MSRPIERTPVVEGEDAERLLASLETGASEEEMAKRIAKAKELRAEMMRPKGFTALAASSAPPPIPPRGASRT